MFVQRIFESTTNILTVQKTFFMCVHIHVHNRCRGKSEELDGKFKTGLYSVCYRISRNITFDNLSKILYNLLSYILK